MVKNLRHAANQSSSSLISSPYSSRKAWVNFLASSKVRSVKPYSGMFTSCCGRGRSIKGKGETTAYG